MIQNCGQCCFFLGGQTDTSDTDGYCRRYPPTPASYSYQEDIVETIIWPTVNEREWCGEFKAVVVRKAMELD